MSFCPRGRGWADSPLSRGRPEGVGQTPSRSRPLPSPRQIPRRQTPISDIEWQPLQRAVRILLKCILVVSASSKEKTSDSCMPNKTCTVGFELFSTAGNLIKTNFRIISTIDRCLILIVKILNCQKCTTMLISDIQFWMTGSTNEISSTRNILR